MKELDGLYTKHIFLIKRKFVKEGLLTLLFFITCEKLAKGGHFYHFFFRITRPSGKVMDDLVGMWIHVIINCESLHNLVIIMPRLECMIHEKGLVIKPMPATFHVLFDSPKELPHSFASSEKQNPRRERGPVLGCLDLFLRKKRCPPKITQGCIVNGTLF